MLTQQRELDRKLTDADMQRYWGSNCIFLYRAGQLLTNRNLDQATGTRGGHYGHIVYRPSRISNSTCVDSQLLYQLHVTFSSLMCSTVHSAGLRLYGLTMGGKGL